MCLESTGLYEIMFNFITKIYIAIPLEGFAPLAFGYTVTLTSTKQIVK